MKIVNKMVTEFMPHTVVFSNRSLNKLSASAMSWPYIRFEFSHISECCELLIVLATAMHVCVCVCVGDVAVVVVCVLL